MNNFGWILFFGGLAAAANLVGGLLLIRQRRRDRRFLEAVLALGAGFMLAAALLAMLPEALHEVGEPRWPLALLVLLGGYLLVQVAEHTLTPHFHFGEETHPEELVAPHVHTATLAGLGTHTFFDGVAIGASFLFSRELGILVFLAVILHKLPEGFTMASISRASGKTARQALGAVAVLSAATLIGALLAGLVPHGAAPYALALSAGVTLYVAASDLIPAVNESKGIRCSLLVFVGVALFWATRELLRLAGLGH